MDLFLSNRPLQPKSAVADHVASRGFYVPQRYESFDEALKSGAPFIMRAEHPQDYDGVSGLMPSLVVTQERLHRAQNDDPKLLDRLSIGLKRRLAGGSDRDLELETARSRHFIEGYCRYLGLNEEDFFSEVSYSYWRLLGGLNRTIVADSAIKGRYHLFTSGGHFTQPARIFHCNYTIVDGGKIVISKGSGLNKEAIYRGIAQAIGYYESIRSLPCFDPNHCPLIECQLVKGIHYFLQYHRCRDFEPASFELTRPPEEGEREAHFVRGATPPEGVVVDTAFYYPDVWGLEEAEGESFDFHYNRVFSEIMSRRRTAFFSPDSLATIALKTVDAHLPKSKLFKPQVSLAVRCRDWLNAGITGKAAKTTMKENVPFRVPVKVVSDGRRALVRFYDRVPLSHVLLAMRANASRLNAGARKALLPGAMFEHTVEEIFSGSLEGRADLKGLGPKGGFRSVALGALCHAFVQMMMFANNLSPDQMRDDTKEMIHSFFDFLESDPLIQWVFVAYIGTALRRKFDGPAFQEGGLLHRHRPLWTEVLRQPAIEIIDDNHPKNALSSQLPSK